MSSPDGWGQAANRHLFAHCLRIIAAGKPVDRAELERGIAAKNAWAQDMRDLADRENAVPIETQKRIWRELVEAAPRQTNNQQLTPNTDDIPF